MDKQLFDDAIGEVPRSTIDVDAVMIRGRRAARLRSVANPVVATGVAVVLVAGAVAFTMMGDDGASPQVGGQPTASTKTEKAPPTTSTSTRSVPMPPAGCARTDLTSAAEVARLSSAAKAVVDEQRPNLQLSTDTSQGLHEGAGPLDFTHYFLDDPASTNKPICHKHAGFAAAANTDGPEGKGNISINVGVGYFNPSGFCDQSSASHCEETTGPNGEIVVEFASQQDNGATANAVYVLRQDGTLILLDAQNASPTGKAPLDYDQLVAIGSDPGMTLFP